MSKSRKMLLAVVLLVLLAAVFIVSDANRRGEAITAGVSEIIDRQPTDTPP